MNTLPQSPKNVLCYINHYYDPNSKTPYFKSTCQKSHVRRGFVENTIERIKELEKTSEVGKIDLKVCGVKDRNLVPIDIDFSFIQNPQFLVFETLCQMAKHLDGYDYFMNIEDDILVPPETFKNIVKFDRHSYINECLHPNRIEVWNGKKVPLDPRGEPRIWTLQEKRYEGRTIRVALNPHSAVLILSREKFGYCIDNIDVNFRGFITGGGMASAYAHFHKPFSLYRPYNDLEFHVVIHQDRIHPCWGLKSVQGRFTKVNIKKKIKLFLPPFLVMTYKKLLRE